MILTADRQPSACPPPALLRVRRAPPVQDPGADTFDPVRGPWGGDLGLSSARALTRNTSYGVINSYPWTSQGKPSLLGGQGRSGANPLVNNALSISPADCSWARRIRG